MCGDVECDQEKFSSRVLCSNVTFDCYVQFQFVRSSEIDTNNCQINKLKYRLHKLENVNPDRFADALNAVSFFP